MPSEPVEPYTLLSVNDALTKARHSAIVSFDRFETITMTADADASLGHVVIPGATRGFGTAALASCLAGLEAAAPIGGGMPLPG